MVEAQIEHAADLIEQADGLLVAAGAGMGVDSGLPDFRGDSGFWRAYPALAQQRLGFAEIASPQTFHTNPELAWGFYGHRLALYRATLPHAGFGLLRAWASGLPSGGFVFTSNVDGQFQAAGVPGTDVAECHGSIHWLQCLRPCTDQIWPADFTPPPIDPTSCRWTGRMPACLHCGGLARPNILMFGDDAWLAQRTDAQEARLAAWFSRLQRPLVIELGAGVHIPSVRHLGQKVIHRHNGRLLRINPREFSVPSRLDVGMACGALEGLSAIDRVIRGRNGC